VTGIIGKFRKSSDFMDVVVDVDVVVHMHVDGFYPHD
jgi:hypothetical protein